MTDEWKLLEEPRSYSKADILDYFGIPPHPENSLEKNIKEKRQFWGKRANGVSGRETAARIKDWIQKLSKILEDGVFPDAPIIHTADGGFKVVGEPQTVAELAEQLEQFLRLGDAANVLATARRALDKWGDDPNALMIIALALSELMRDYGPPLPEVAQLTAGVTQRALAVQPRNPQAWLARARYALAVGAKEELHSLEASATAAGAVLPAESYGIIASYSFRTGNIDGGIQSLIRQVIISNGDPAVRSTAVDAMLQEVILPRLPIVDKQGAVAYAEAVRVAAWLAQGVPESESELVAYRVWAQQALGGVFIGNLVIKSFLGVLTGFLALPLYGKAVSKPGWRVLRDGPTHKNTWEQWLYLSDGEYVEQVHAKAKDRFPWEAWFGQRWPKTNEVEAYIRREGFTDSKGNRVKQK